MTHPERAPRTDNRLPQVLDAAASLFRTKGYASTSMRDIAQAAGMLPGSLYYHFPSKEELLVAVYSAGVERVAGAVREAVAGVEGPWARLEAACRAHLEALLGGSDFAQVVIRIFPGDAPGVEDRLAALREGYERQFRGLVEDLPLAADADARLVRLFLLGALNWAQFWYRPGGAGAQEIAAGFVRLLRAGARAGKEET
ncbi:MAG TPA: TetR/AcrR family transcriptional regulator [Pelomicrobium sp.]|nr:TetR/AcrR family transcriptional regulator [Pelomicrobium sp.]